MRIVEDWAVARLDPATLRSRPRVLSLVDGMMLSRLTSPVGAIASRLDLRPRQLRNMVLDEFGMSPKALLGHARFEHAWSTLYRTGSISQASALFAYQAHLTRAFRRYEQLTPSQYRRLKASGDAIRNGVDRRFAEGLGVALG